MHLTKLLSRNEQIMSQKVAGYGFVDGKSLPTSNADTTVKISVRGKTLSEQGIKAAYSNRILDLYKSNPEEATKAAKDYTYNNDLLLIPTPTSLKIEDSRFLDGTPVTDKAYIGRFESEAGNFRQQRIELYESEKPKGTPAAEIMRKLFDMYDNLPDAYKLKIGYL